MSKKERVPVVQADRDAAAYVHAALYGSETPGYQWIVDGEQDDETLVQTLAAHRLAFQRPADAGDVVMVPREPTEAMVKEALDLTEWFGDDNRAIVLAVWREMLAASPSLPVGETGLGGYPDVEALANRPQPTEGQG